MIEIIPNWHSIWVHFAVALLSILAISRLAITVKLTEKLESYFRVRL